MQNYSNLFQYEFYQNNQILRINNLNLQNDTGIYECLANNSVNQIKSSAKLTIIPASKPYFQILQQNISVFEDHQITLECFAEGTPKPQVLWYK
jgi:receptor-type tyrosine-protein phosphatase F